MARKAIAKNIAYDEQRKTYYVTMDYGKDEKGKRLKKVETFKELKEAKQALKIFEGDKTKGVVVKPVKETVKDFCEYWLEFEKSGTRQTTKWGYVNILKNHVYVYFKNKELQKVSKQDIHRYMVWLTDKGLSSNTVCKHYTLLKDMFSSAERAGKIFVSPLKTIKPPKKEKPKTSIYTVEQVKVLLEKVKGDRIELPVRLAVSMGLRRGEICGLRFKNVNLKEKYIDIVESRVEIGDSIVEGGVKSDFSERQIEIPDSLIPVLERIKAEQKQNKKDFEDDYYKDDFVFCWADGRPYRPNFLSDLFSDFLKKHELPHIRFHDLRHTFGSIAVLNAPLREVSKAMGHSREDFTDKVYIKDLQKTKRVAVNAVDNILNV